MIFSINIPYYLMELAACMGGLGSKFKIKCMPYNRVGIFYVLCGFYERKKKSFLYWKCGILWNSRMQRRVSSVLANCQWSSNIGLLTIQLPDAPAILRIFYWIESRFVISKNAVLFHVVYTLHSWNLCIRVKF